MKRSIIKCLKLVDIGRDRVCARFIGLYNLVALTSTFLLVKGINLKFSYSIIAFFCLMVIMGLLGFFWINSGSYAVDAEVDNKANPFTIEMRERLEKIEKHIKEKGRT